jgi:hypothetical protein
MALMLAAAASAQAAVISYKFDPGSSFDFGGGNTYAAVGTFDFDTTSFLVSAVAYSGVQIGTGPTGPFDFTSTDGVPSDTVVTFTGDCCSDVDQFIFGSSLTLGGTIGIAGFIYNGSTRLPVTGSITAASVPEPITLSLFGMGLAGAVAMRRRKKA